MHHLHFYFSFMQLCQLFMPFSNWLFKMMRLCNKILFLSGGLALIYDDYNPEQDGKWNVWEILFISNNYCTEWLQRTAISWIDFLNEARGLHLAALNCLWFPLRLYFCETGQVTARAWGEAEWGIRESWRRWHFERSQCVTVWEAI